MAKVRSWVGLDVHAAKVVACVVDAESGEMTVHRLSGETVEVVAFCSGLPRPTRAAYEAGPTGYGLARALAAAGIGCVVAAPGKIERPARDKIKTDARDAERLVRLLMIDALHAVRVPTSEREALRDLVRAREDVRVDLMRARQRLSKLLLRHDVRYEDTTSRWGERHRRWLAQIDLGQSGAQATLTDYVGAVEALELRRGTLEAAIAQLVPDTPCAQAVAQLRCLRGIDTLSAVGLAVEIGDFERFQRPGQLMAYVGLVPSEHSTGQTRRQGHITKSGSQHARRLLVEAAWHYRRHHASEPRSSAASKSRARPWSRSPGKPSSDCTTSGAGLTASATCAARSSRSQSRATSPGPAGRSSTTTTTTRSSQTNRRDSQNARALARDRG